MTPLEDNNEQIPGTAFILMHLYNIDQTKDSFEPWFGSTL